MGRRPPRSSVVGCSERCRALGSERFLVYVKTEVEKEVKALKKKKKERRRRRKVKQSDDYTLEPALLGV